MDLSQSRGFKYHQYCPLNLISPLISRFIQLNIYSAPHLKHLLDTSQQRTSNLTHTPTKRCFSHSLLSHLHPIHQQILLGLPSEYIQNPTTSHHLHYFHPGLSLHSLSHDQSDLLTDLSAFTSHPSPCHQSILNTAARMTMLRNQVLSHYTKHCNGFQS